MFADDCKLYKTIETVQDAVELQGYVQFAMSWAADNCISFNIEKCQVLTFSKSANPVVYPYEMDGSILSRPESVRDLGVTFVKKLSFNDHISKTVAQSTKTLGFVIRTSKGFNNDATILQLYTSLVRSRLEYAALVWDPAQQVLKDQLERVQKRFLRFLYFRKHGRYPHYADNPVSTVELLEEFGLQSLEQRRSVASAVFFHKLLNGQVDFPSALGSVCLNASRSLRWRQPFRIPLARTNVLAHSPLWRMMRQGNSISETIDLFDSPLSAVKAAAADLL